MPSFAGKPGAGGGPLGGGSGGGWQALNNEALGAQGAVAGPRDAKDGKEARDPSLHTRTEFVILFIWKEPTPSDALRGMAGPAGAAPAPKR
jgi:hypothetical protein